jgi:hypothetical protein
MERWNDDVSRVRYAHLQTLLPLQKRRAEIVKRQEDIQRQRDAKFPLTVDEYRNIRNTTTQLRVATFLAAEANAQGHAIQEKAMKDYGWVWRQVKPLKDEFANNVSLLFATRSELGALISLIGEIPN